MIRSVLLVLAAFLVGCGAPKVPDPTDGYGGRFSLPWSGDDEGKATAPQGGATAGEAATYSTFRWITVACLVPAILATVASVWFPPLRALSGVLIGATVASAAAPFLLDRYAGAVVLAIGGSVIVGGGAWFAVWLVQWSGRRAEKRRTVKDGEKRIAELTRSASVLAKAGGDERKVADRLGAAIGIRRLIDPRADEWYRARSRRAKDQESKGES